MLRFTETKVTKEKFCAARKPIEIWDDNVHNIVKINQNKSQS